MNDHLESIVRNMTYIMGIITGLINFFMFYKKENYKKKFEAYYGVDSENIDAFIWRNKSLFFRGLFLFFLIIFMMHTINSIEIENSFTLYFVIIGNILFIIGTSVNIYFMTKIVKDNIPLYLGFAIVVLFFYGFCNDFLGYSILESKSKIFVWIAALYLDLILVSSVQAMSTLFLDDFEKKTYEIITYRDRKYDAEIYAKLGKTKDGFLVSRCRKGSIGSFDDKVLKEMGIEDSKAKDTILFIEKYKYRFVDPKDVDILLIDFDQVRVVHYGIFEMLDINYFRNQYKS